MNTEARLKTFYKETVVAKLREEFSYGNVMEVPCLEKICINQGVGQGVADKKLVDTAVEEISLITGQKAQPSISKRDVSNFKLRKGVAIGAKVTLRRKKMYEFLDRLVSVSLPAVRDFDGIKASGFDGRGNFTMGITEQIIFPEISVDKVNKITGMDITFVTTAKTDKEAFALLKELGIPFKKN